MNSSEVLRIVDAIHHDKNIEKEIVFEGIEQAILSAAKKHYGEEEDLAVQIDRESGQVSAQWNAEPIPEEDLDMLGRIAAQTAKQVMIQKIREAERDSLYDEYVELRTHLVTGVVTRVDHGVAIVNLGKVEALLPKSEQIPGETHRVNERVRAIVLDVRKAGSRVKIILSRTHPEMVRRLFEIEIPEVSERVIEVRSLAREAGYRSKVAVSCIDTSIDAVGACVGVRGSRIRSIVDELAGERIDIVRWNDSLQVLIPNALQPAEVEDVILCPMLGRVIVLVQEDQLSLAIGKKGQNVRLASKLVGWDIEVMTREELDEQLDRSVQAFSTVPHVTDELAELLVSQGFFSFEDLSVIEPDQLQELSGFSPEECDEITAYADVESEREEREADLRKQREREARALAEAQAAAAEALKKETETEQPPGEPPQAAEEPTPTGEPPTVEGSPADEATEAERTAEPAAVSAETDVPGGIESPEAESSRSAEAAPSEATGAPDVAAVEVADVAEESAVEPAATETPDDMSPPDETEPESGLTEERIVADDEAEAAGEEVNVAEVGPDAAAQPESPEHAPVGGSDGRDDLQQPTTTASRNVDG